MREKELNKHKRRRVKYNCFISALKQNIDNVEIVMNHIDKFYVKYGEFDDQMITDELEETYFELELTLATLAVLIRKMHENSYIEIPHYIREDVNALIHSAKFVYDLKERFILVYSRRGEEKIQMSSFLDYAKSLIGTQN
ncbi:MAG: hypothetical protein KHY88_04505 [Erysipelotrichaceae bacterium]|nr:hypothetical protein [Erysipelotrichaceae bacterium]